MRINDSLVLSSSECSVYILCVLVVKSGLCRRLWTFKLRMIVPVLFTEVYLDLPNEISMNFLCFLSIVCCRLLFWFIEMYQYSNTHTHHTSNSPICDRISIEQRIFFFLSNADLDSCATLRYFSLIVHIKYACCFLSLSFSPFSFQFLLFSLFSWNEISQKKTLCAKKLSSIHHLATANYYNTNVHHPLEH